MMIHQENDFKLREHDHDLHESVGLSHLHINGFASAIKPHHNSSFHPPPCTSCGCGSTSSSIPSIYPPADTITITNNRNNPMKRTSSVDSSTLNEPKSKRYSLHHTDSSHVGYSKSLFPCTTTPPLPSETETQTLHSCVSDPYSSPKQDLPDHSSGSGNLVQSPPEKAQFGSESQDATTPLSSSAVKGRESFTLPPFPPVLTRSASDPISTPVKTFSRSSSSAERLSMEFIRDESPDSKRLKRIKDYMKHMSQWVDAIMLEDMEDGRTEVSNEVQKDDYESDVEEAVSVERVGENLKVNFMCPCSRAYQILISGGSCYYKLL